MTVTNVSSFIPYIVVKPMTDNFWEEMTYLPGLSTIKGTYDILAATIKTVAAVALLAFSAFILQDAVMNGGVGIGFVGFVIGGLGLEMILGVPEVTRQDDVLYGPMSAIKMLGRGLLELVPVVGNLSLAFLDGRIQINPKV